MKIHTVKKGETIFSIAEKYTTSPEKIIEYNGIRNPNKLAVGNKLLIVIPTKTYTAKYGDTLEKIQNRFSVSLGDLYKKNPSLIGKNKLYPGQIITLKLDTPPYPMAFTNGYYTKECPKEKLMGTLPYLNYITVCGARTDCGTNLKIPLGTDKILKLARENDIIPILRIYDESDGCCSDEKYLNNISLAAKSTGFDHIMLTTYRHKDKMSDEYYEKYKALRDALRAQHIELFLEHDANNYINGEKLCTGTVLHQKSHMENQLSFADEEERIFNEIAENSDTSKLFLELPSQVNVDGKCLDISEFNDLAFSSQSEIFSNDETLMSSFMYRPTQNSPHRNVTFENLDNIKARLDLVDRLGYMGVCFDIASVPVNYLVMFHCLFTNPCYKIMPR